MEKKSFLIEEHQEVIFDNDKLEEWKALAEELGATGQLELTDKKNKSSSMVPFPVMTEAEATIYGELFNQKQPYKKFRAEAIPIEGLSLIALAEKENYFDSIQVWYSTDNPDPIIVGKRFRSDNDRENGYDWNMFKYWVFQWGAKLKPLADLVPIYDKYVRENFDKDYQDKISNHEANMKRFKFQIASFQ
jgi:hypothetical protein